MLPRLYAIIDIDLVTARGFEPVRVLRDWLDAGVRLIQLRAKPLTFGPLLALADEMAEECRGAEAIFIVNDRVDVAALVGASGVHLGQDDLSPEQARRLLPDAAWIGLSTHTEAQMAAAAPSVASYVAIGPVFVTATKANPDPVIGLDGVARVAPMARRAGKPLVAIGGITLETAPAVIAAGADSVAVISGLLSDLGQGGIGARARALIHALR